MLHGPGKLRDVIVIEEKEVKETLTIVTFSESKARTTS